MITVYYNYMTFIIVDGPSTSSVSNMVNGLDKHLPSFWVPSKTPTAKKSKLEKPVKT